MIEAALRPATAGRFLTLGLHAFAVVGWELVLLLVDPLFGGTGASSTGR